MGKKLSRRNFLRGFGAAAAGTALAACQAQTVVVKETVETEKIVKETVEVEKVVEKVVTTVPGERVRVTWYAWGNPMDPGRYNDYEAAFDSYGLDVILETILTPSGEEYYIKLMAAVAAGTGPDCCSLWGEFLGKFIQEGVLRDLKPYAEASGLDFNDYWEGMMKPAMREGGWWGWPWGSEPSAILYNEVLFEEAGLDMPYDLWKKNEWTWSAYLEAAKKLTKVDDKGFAQVLGTWDPLDVNASEVFIKANGGTGWFSPDGKVVTVTEDKAVEAVQYVADLNLKHAVTPGEGSGQVIGEGNAWANFQAGVVGMIQMYIVAPGWLTNRGEQEIPFPINFVPFPRTDDGSNYYTTWNHNEVGMTSSSKHPDEAWTFLEFFGSEAGAKVWLDSTYFHVVPNKSIMQSEEYLTKVPGFDATVCLEMMDLEMFVARPEPLEVFRFRDISAEELGAIKLKTKPVAEALDSFSTRMQPILDEA